MSVMVPTLVLPFNTTFTPGKGPLSVPLTTVPFTCMFCAYTEAKVKLNINKTDKSFFMCLTLIVFDLIKINYSQRVPVLELCKYIS